MDDWRIRNQRNYLSGRTFYKHTYSAVYPNWTHDHCEFCCETIGIEGESFSSGYSTLDDYYWICSECFSDFAKQFQLQTIDTADFSTSTICEILEREIDMFQNSELFDAARVEVLLSNITAKVIKPCDIEVIPAVVSCSDKKTMMQGIKLFEEKKACLDNAQQVSVLMLIDKYREDKAIRSCAKSKDRLLLSFKAVLI